MSTKLAWPDKDPDEVLDYDIDWSSRMSTGDVIVDSQWTKVTGSITIDSDTASSLATKIWLSGGTLGETCEFLNRITTQDGRVMDQTVFIKVKKR